MSTATRTAKVKLVTIVLPSELAESFIHALRDLGVNGYTAVKAEGGGHHGRRVTGFVESANVRVEVLASPAVAKAIFAFVEKRYREDAVIAFVADVEAIPHDKFG
jgi:hypothetical protein